MSLEQDLADFRAQSAQTTPPGRAELYEAKIEELRATFALEQTPAVGSVAPDFSLPNARGNWVSLTEVLEEGAAVVTFYRGGWCPYCNLQLRAYQQVLPEIKALGARLMAISAQLPDKSLSTAEKNALEFDVLSDVGNHVARAFGLVYSLPEELRRALISNQKSLPQINGDSSWELPVPATYVIAAGRRVALAHVDVDYRRRLEPQQILAALKQLHASS